jgi:hypothetical protein
MDIGLQGINLMLLDFSVVIKIKKPEINRAFLLHCCQLKLICFAFPPSLAARLYF